MNFKSIARRALAPVFGRLDARSAHQARVVLDEADTLGAPDTSLSSGALDTSVKRVFVPPIDNVTSAPDAPFMQFATCSAADMLHPRFADLLAMIGQTPVFHRKQWEFGYVLHHLVEQGALRPGARGLGFGVGLEHLPAAFANLGVEVTASDAPAEITAGVGWTETDQHAMSVDDLPNPGLCDPDDFRRLVSYRPVDMNHIDEDLTGFDFCWSACCFEHLGSIRHGLDFVKQSVEHCLAPGGIAVHTTELNLSSNTDTVESPHLSLFRRSDLQELIDELRADGHTVSDLIVAPDSHYLDQYVDIPPYSHDLHLKLELAGHVTTSVGLVVRKAD